MQVGKVFGATAKRVISVFVALSALGNVLTITFAQSRVNQEISKEGIIPFSRFWASNWPGEAPGPGLLLHFIPSIIVIVGTFLFFSSFKLHAYNQTLSSLFSFFSVKQKLY